MTAVCYPALGCSRRVTIASCSPLEIRSRESDITDGPVALIRASEASLGAGRVEKMSDFQRRSAHQTCRLHDPAFRRAAISLCATS